MRSARMILATAAASAALAVGAPGAYAAAGDTDHDDSSYSKEEHGKPDGGMHTGGGALRDTAADDEADKESGKDEDSWGGGHEKPSGGVHTGGGALAGPSATAAGLGVLAVAGTGIHALRRRKSAGSVV
ncbi:hypothetical protein [Streptomyces sp. NPDC000618]|uniref:hypothetical protein n=1 Tax=Streptomyces sp. NPDC000618 TaxID=3154265 RepID=UPI003330985E